MHLDKICCLLFITKYLQLLRHHSQPMSFSKQAVAFELNLCIHSILNNPDMALASFICGIQGLGGAVCLWMDVLAPEHAASFPGYEL